MGVSTQNSQSSTDKEQGFLCVLNFCLLQTNNKQWFNGVALSPGHMHVVNSFNPLRGRRGSPAISCNPHPPSSRTLQNPSGPDCDSPSDWPPGRWPMHLRACLWHICAVYRGHLQGCSWMGPSSGTLGYVCDRGCGRSFPKFVLYILLLLLFVLQTRQQPGCMQPNGFF